MEQSDAKKPQTVSESEMSKSFFEGELEEEEEEEDEEDEEEGSGMRKEAESSKRKMVIKTVTEQKF